MTERRFIAIGVSEHPSQPDLDRPEVLPALERMCVLLNEQGYQRELTQLGANPRRSDLGELETWCSDPRTDTVLAFYFTGHGSPDPTGHRLLLHDYDRRKLDSTSLAAATLGDWLTRPRCEAVLLVLDACYAGLDAGQVVSAFLRALPSDAANVRVAIIASALPKQEASAGEFPKALEAALKKICASRRCGGPEQQFLDLSALIGLVNEELPSDQRALALTLSDRTLPFFPNPQYRKDAPTGVDLASQQLSLLQHFLPKARGVEAGEAWYFTGRHEALRELVGFLRVQAGEPGRLLLVTGQPGTGKSALLGRLAVLSHPELRQRALGGSAVVAGTVPDPNAIDLVLHARGKTLRELTDAIAAHWQIELSEGETEARCRALTHALGNPERMSGQGLRVVVDALDEASSGQADGIARHLLLPLSQTPGVRVVVGTRKHLLSWLGASEAGHAGAVQVIDLGDARYAERAAIAEYVKQRLCCADEPARSTPYRDQPDLARMVSEVVAEAAHPLYLLARAATELLLEDQAPVDTREPSWQTKLGQRFAGGVEGVVEAYLAQLGEERKAVESVLTALAFGQGLGLPFGNVLGPIANALGNTVTPAAVDVDRALDRAAAYIIVDRDAERTVYRLYHERVAEHLRSKHIERAGHRKGAEALLSLLPRNMYRRYHERRKRRTEREVHRQITEALRSPLPKLGGLPDLRFADAYARKYLASHAARGEVLDDLLKNPTFLLEAEPQRLLAALRGIAPQIEASTFEHAEHLMRDRPRGEAAAYLQLSARKLGAQALARRIDALELANPWSARWVSWQVETPHRVVAELGSWVTSVAQSALNGKPVLVVGAVDGRLHLLSASDGTPIRQPMHGHTGPIRSVAVYERDGQPCAISGSLDGSLRLWNLQDGTPMGMPLRGHKERVTSVAVYEQDGQPCAISGSADSTLRLWDLRDGTPMGAPLRGHSEGVWGVAVYVRDGQLCAVSGSKDRTLRLWNLRDGSPLDVSLQGHTERITSLAVYQRDGQPCAISGSQDHTLRLWNLRDGRSLSVPLEGHKDAVTSVAVFERGGQSYAVSGSADSTLRLWNLQDGSPLGTLHGHAVAVTSVAVYEREGQSYAVSGGTDSTLRLWNLQDVRSQGRMLPGPTRVTRVAAYERNGQPCVVSGSLDGTLRLWNLQDGSPLGATLQGHTERVTGLALFERDGQPYALSGSEDHTLRLWNLQDGRRIGEPLLVHTGMVTSLAVYERDSQPCAVSGSADSTLRQWNLQDGSPLGIPLRGHTEAVTSVAVYERGGQPCAISGSEDMTLRLWNLQDGSPMGEPLRGHTGTVTCVAMHAQGTQPCAMSCSEDMTLRLWNLQNGSPMGEPLRGHTEAVTSAAVFERAGVLFAVSGSRDRTLRVWRMNPSLELQCIEVGTYVEGVAVRATSRELYVVAATAHGIVTLRLDGDALRATTPLSFPRPPLSHEEALRAPSAPMSFIRPP